MGLSCDCFGYASASKRPVKRYNLLVPDIFPKNQPAVDQPVDASTQRQFKRLYEYLQKNPSRTPKVSRRLARRLHKDLRARHYGYVSLVGQSLKYLLQMLPSQDSSLFAKELICQHVDWDLAKKGNRRDFDAPQLHSVVGTLLLHSLVELRTTGAQILHQFVLVQTSSAFMEQIQEFVPLVCQSAGRQPHAVKTVKGVLPDTASLAALNAASLRCLQAYLQLCMRVVVISPYLQQIEKTILDMLQPGDDLPVSTAQGGRDPAAGVARADSTASSSGPPQLPATAASGSDDPSAAALAAWLQLAVVARDALEGRKVLDFLLAYLDRRGSWTSGDGMLDATLGSLRKAGGDPHQRYMLLCALLKHSRGAELAEGARLPVLQQAVLEADSMEPLVAFPALVFALRELPVRQLSPAAAPAQDSSLQAAAPGAAQSQALAVAVIEALARRTSDAAHVAEAVGGVCASLPAEPEAACSTVQLCISAAVAAAASHQGRGRSGMAMPQLLLQDVAQQQLQGGQPALRELMLALLCALLPLSLPQGLKETQASAILSACWHQSQKAQQGEESGLLQLLMAVSKHCSPSALPQPLQLAYTYHLQAISPEGLPPNQTPDTGSSVPAEQSDVEAETGGKPGIVSTAVHAVGSILHSALGSSPSPAESPRGKHPQPKQLSSFREGSSNGDLPSASAGCQRDSTATGQLAAGEPQSNGDVSHDAGPADSRLPAQAAPGRDERSAVLHRRLQAARCHDALLVGAAERLQELVPEHSFTASLPLSQDSGDALLSGADQLSSWLSHAAHSSRSSWQQPWEQGLGSVLGSGKQLRSLLQQPFRPVLPAALLPRAKVRASRDDASRGSSTPRGATSTLRQRLLQASSSTRQQPALAASAANKLPTVQELLQASDAVEAADGPAPATGSCACQPISPDALLAKLDDLDQPARLATGTAATGGVAGMLHLPQLLQAT